MLQEILPSLLQYIQRVTRTHFRLVKAGIVMLFGMAFFVYPGQERLRQNHLIAAGSVVFGEAVVQQAIPGETTQSFSVVAPAGSVSLAGAPRKLPPPSLASLVMVNAEYAAFPNLAQEDEEGTDEGQAFYLDALPTVQGVAFLGSAAPITQQLIERSERYEYLVEEGDTPIAIAELFGISLDTLLWANGLTAYSIIKPGQKLTILPVSGIEHIVAKGDTIASIAKKYSASANDILAFNTIAEEMELVIGTTVIVPNGIKPAPPAPVRVKPRVVTRQNFDAPSGWLVPPASGRNSRPGTGLHGFNGIDIANHCGTTIVAAAAGSVIIADGIGWNGGYGRYVKIQHSNGVITLYGHARELLVGTGVEVAQGQAIALMGSSGRSSGCHVHFEVRGAANPFAGRRSF